MVKPPSKQIPIFIAIVALIIFGLNTGQVLAFTNNRYLTYGNKKVPVTSSAKPQVLGSYTINDACISGLVTKTVNQMVLEGLLKGEKGDKGDPGGEILGDNSNIAPAPVTYSSDYGGSIAGVTSLSGQELSAGDLTVTSSVTVNQGVPVEIDGPSNFTASTTMADLQLATIEASSGAYLSQGGDWVNASSRNLKENFATTSPADILTKIDSLPIYTWNYKSENQNIVHMGPVAEDFYSTFGLGNSSSSISTIDPAGVALAGIQGLDAKIISLMDISWILNGLKNLGLDIEQSFIKVAGLVADMVQTKQLEVGSAGQPAGITIYDTVTKQPICIFSANNILQSQPGKCQDVIISTQNQPAINPIQNFQEDNSTTTISEPPITSDASSSASSTLNNLTTNN